MDSIELRYHRDNTTAFISVKASIITLTPQTKTRTASKGYTFSDGEARPSQVMRIIELGFNQVAPIIRLTDGSQRAVDFWLLGQWDAQIAVDDYWVAEDGRTWLVGDIVRPNGYETRALVVERGR